MGGWCSCDRNLQTSNKENRLFYHQILKSGKLDKLISLLSLVFWDGFYGFTLNLAKVGVQQCSVQWFSQFLCKPEFKGMTIFICSENSLCVL